MGKIRGRGIPAVNANAEIETYLNGLEKGDEAMLAQLLEHYKPRLLKVVTLYMAPSLSARAEAEDVVQEAFIDATQQITNYTSRRGAVDFYVWLRGVAMQRLSKFHRFHLGAQRRSVARQLALPDHSSLLLGQQLISRGSAPSEHLRKQELRDQVERAVRNLPETDRETIVMRHFEGLTNTEVAQVLGLKPSTATMRYGRALARLRTALIEDAAMGESTS